MTPIKKFAIKLYVFSAILLYMAGDLYVWHGPLAQKFERHFSALRIPPNDDSPLQTVVYGEGITKNQYDRRTREIALASGHREATAATALPGTVKLGLIDEALLRLRARANDMRLPDTRKEAEQSVERMAARHSDPADFEAWLATQGYTRASLTDKIEARLKEAATVHRSIDDNIVPTDENVAAYYERLKNRLATPASRQIGHIFYASLHQEPETLAAKAKETHAKLAAQTDPETLKQQFAELARTQSEDKRTAPNGGNLGTIYDNTRRPFSDLALFDEQTLPAGKPVLLQSKLGWHIFLASDITPGSIPPLDDVKDSLRTAILNWQTRYAAEQYREQLRKEAFFKKKIQHHDQ